MPTSGRPAFRARLACAIAAFRPAVCGKDTRAIVHPLREDGQDSTPVVPTSPGAATVSVVGTVANPPIAVRMWLPPPPPPPAAAAAAAPPATATTSARSARLTQPRPGASTEPRGPGPGRR